MQAKSANRWLVGALLLAGCSEAATPAAKPPVAGLVHPELALVGQPVPLDGSSSAVAGARLVRFRIAVADGSAAVELANPVTQHVFLAPGSYGVELTVFDDHGGQGSVQSTVRVVESFAPACQDSVQCQGAPCLSGSCAVLACGGDPACPAILAGQATFCDQGVCSASAGPEPQDAWGGEDAGTLPLDGK